MFIRVKKVHEYEYAYICRSVWNSETKKSKQEVVAYLGNLKSERRLNKMDFALFDEEQKELIDAYLEKIKEDEFSGDKKKGWKSRCPNCEGIKARQARICGRCSTNNRFHGWVTPDLVQKYSYNTKNL